MRTHAICLALAIVLTCPSASAQSVQTNGLNERQVPHHPSMSTNVFQGIPLELQGFPTQHSPRGEIISRLDSLRASRLHLPPADGKFIPNGIQRSPRPLQKMSSPHTQIYVIDTAIVRSTSDTTRHLYLFNARGRRTADLAQVLTGDLWVDILRETNTYDASNNMLSDLNEEWSNGQWVKAGSCHTYNYDAGNNLLLDLYEYWNTQSTGQRDFLIRWTYTYDVSNNMLSALAEGWSNGQWENSTRKTYTYDAIGNRLSELWETWSNGQWENYLRYAYTYDAIGNMTSALWETWWSNGQWTNIHRHTYAYDANNKMLSDLNEYWSNGQWVNDERFTYTFDVNGNMLSALFEVWSNGQWTNTHRRTYAYDVNSEMLSDLDEYWSNGQWVNERRKTFTNDGQGNLTELWSFSWSNGSWHPDDLPFSNLGGPQYYHITDRAGNNYSYWGCNFTFTYKLIVTGIGSKSGNAPAVYSLAQNYPNPFNPSTTIHYQVPSVSNVTVKVFDLLGRELALLVNERKNPGTYEAQFDGSKLSSGVYFYRMEAGAFVQTRKLVLMK